MTSSYMIPNASLDEEAGCGVRIREARRKLRKGATYVIATAKPGYTMSLQGMEVAVGRLHPEFVIRLSNAIREARNAGLASAGVYSAYRPPAFGVGGFSDKFHSLHTYGLAVDMHGIGKAGSSEAQLWHEIAARNGVVCPYGPRHRAEWNHCQPTSLKIILAENPLRETVTADGPLDLDSMFEVGNSVIESMASAADSLARAAATPVRALEAAAKKGEPMPDLESQEGAKRASRLTASAATSPARAATPSRAVKARCQESASQGPIVKARKESKRASRFAADRDAGKSLRRPREKLDARLRLKKTPVIAVEEGRRKSKVPAVDVSPRLASRSS